eukprot:1303764-Rhodomonas_salina.6
MKAVQAGSTFCLSVRPLRRSVLTWCTCCPEPLSILGILNFERAAFKEVLTLSLCTRSNTSKALSFSDSAYVMESADEANGHLYMCYAVSQNDSENGAPRSSNDLMTPTGNLSARCHL